MDMILGDRRSDRRYELRLPMHYKLIRGRRVLHEGTAYTSNVGRGGVAFTANRFLPSGLAIEISIEWPILIRGHESIQLRIKGRISRSDGVDVAVRTAWYDFVRAETAKPVQLYTEARPAQQAFMTM